MAKSVTKIRKRENHEELMRQQQIDKVQSLFADHTDELEQTMRLLELLQEKGLLDAGVAVLEQGHDLLDILVNQANRPSSLGGLKTLIAIVQGITKIDAKLLSAVFNGIGDASQVISGGETENIADLWDIVRVMRDPAVSAGLTAMFAVLKAVGQNLQTRVDSQSKSSSDDLSKQRRDPVAT